MDEDVINNDGLGHGKIIFEEKFECPKHGTINSTITSTMQGCEGDYCMRCWIETLQKVEKSE